MKQPFYDGEILRENCGNREKKNAARRKLCYSVHSDMQIKTGTTDWKMERTEYGENQKKIGSACLYSGCHLDFLGNLYADV